MFELKLARAGLLKKVVGSIKDLLTIASFDCSPIGFSLQASDASQVALVDLLLHSDGFEQYRCDGNISMGINLDNMAKMLHYASDDDVVTMKAEDNGVTVNFILESRSQDKISEREMKLMCIDSDTEHPLIPDFPTVAEYQAIVGMPSSVFAKICKDLDTIGDGAVRISATEEEILFYTSGDIGTARFRCTKTFASQYLVEFAKATPLADQVMISMSNGIDTPILVEYGMENIGYIRFYLGPRIEELEVTGPEAGEKIGEVNA